MSGVLNLCIRVVFLLLEYVYAIPTTRERSVSTSDFSNLNLFAEYSCAAYCKKNIDNNAPAGGPVVCSHQYCPSVNTGETFMLGRFESTGITDIAGYVVSDEARQLIIVSFRGSHSIANWVADFTPELVDNPVCTGCRSHLGFLTSWSEIADNITSALTRGFNLYPNYGLVVTGHSLGGAVATLAAAQLRNSGYRLALYTYGAPAPGNQALAKYVASQPGGHYRVTHYDDPVPQVPPSWAGYAQISPEYYITTGTNVPATASDIQVLPNSDGDVNTFFHLNFLAHCWYFNSICGCGSC